MFTAKGISRMKRYVECFSESNVTTFVRFSEIEPEVADHVVAGKRLPQWDGKFQTPKMEWLSLK